MNHPSDLGMTSKRKFRHRAIGCEHWSAHFIIQHIMQKKTGTSHSNPRSSMSAHSQCGQRVGALQADLEAGDHSFTKIARTLRRKRSHSLEFLYAKLWRIWRTDCRVDLWRLEDVSDKRYRQNSVTNTVSTKLIPNPIQKVSSRSFRTSTNWSKTAAQRGNSLRVHQITSFILDQHSVTDEDFMSIPLDTSRYEINPPRKIPYKI